jgi:hypothetical protein
MEAEELVVLHLTILTLGCEKAGVTVDRTSFQRSPFSTVRSLANMVRLLVTELEPLPRSVKLAKSFVKNWRRRSGSRIISSGWVPE